LRTVSGDGRPSGFFDPIVIIARAGWEVCDGAHRRFVMHQDSKVLSFERCVKLQIASIEPHSLSWHQK
jgi:hypothetical protein